MSKKKRKGLFIYRDLANETASLGVLSASVRDEVQKSEGSTVFTTWQRPDIRWYVPLNAIYVTRRYLRKISIHVAFFSLYKAEIIHDAISWITDYYIISLKKKIFNCFFFWRNLCKVSDILLSRLTWWSENLNRNLKSIVCNIERS